MSPPADREDLAFAIDVATTAGATTLELFQSSSLAIEHKGDGSPVTEADRRAETLVRDMLATTFPADAVVGEEHADTEGTSGRRWVVDPIDGTKAFTKGVPLFATLIALIDEHGPAIGVVHLPALGETVAAGRGLGATLNGEPCSVSASAGLAGAYLMTSGFGYWPPAALTRTLASPAVLRTWGDAYGYALVATGRAEAMIDPIVNPWDVAPMAVIIPEAGGRFSTVSGDDGPDAYLGGSGVASNGAVHDAVLGLLGD